MTSEDVSQLRVSMCASWPLVSPAHLDALRGQDGVVGWAL